MSVHETQTIDRCGLANDGTALLTMYCGGRLGQDYTIEDIAEKAETYLDFVLSGQLESQVPSCKGKPVVIRISCEYWPHSENKPRFLKIANQLEEYNIKLVIDVSAMHGKGGIFDYATDSNRS